ncbi:MAG: DNA helicase II [Pseudomonadota bacterium]
MDVSHLLDELNEAQRTAVTAEAGNHLVLAGAGSGKTRVLVHRIAWLIEVMGFSPFNVLAVTFTNKAAAEMRQRTEALLGGPSRGSWIGTFHGIAHRLLRLHHDEANLPATFQILDSDDQLRLLKRVIRDLELDDASWPARRAQWFINDRKDEGQRPDHIDPGADPITQGMVNIYRSYEDYCQRAGLVDFAELLLRAHELWLNRPAVLEHYQNRFRQVLVDEFQDTNAIQYAWVRVLTGDTGNAFVVGDDDQSIYGWRGARVEHMQRFTKEFADVVTHRLEQNYRSTGTILSAANAVINHNDDRLGKNLWTAGSEGDRIEIFAAHNEYDESRFVVSRIEQWLEEGRDANEVALLYRSNAQSRLFEELLVNNRIPYRVYGGLRFFERAEIKDVLAYLRLLASRDDDTAFDRVVNVPARGIGERTVACVREAARDRGCSLWRAAQVLIVEEGIGGRAAGALGRFLELIDQMDSNCGEQELEFQIEHVTRASNLIAHYEKEPAERLEGRRENLAELVNAGRGFALPPDDEEAGLSRLESFLAHAALEAGEGQAEAWENCVQLMTLHSAKGLEFPLVFMVGMEQGLFPNQRAADEPGRLEEERRLCYVGITRAMEHLVLTHAESRRWHGSQNFQRPSRFLKELPRELIHEVRPRTGIQRQAPGQHAPIPEDTSSRLALGTRVRHKTFGEGMVMDFEGAGDHARVQVNFEGAGRKWLVLSYANLEEI